VVWREGGGRHGAYQAETFSIGSDAQNLARADGFMEMVEAAGQHWPGGWVRGVGFGRPSWEADRLKPPPRSSRRPACSRFRPEGFCSPRLSRGAHGCAVGRMTISLTSTSAGCSIAKAIARPIASGEIATVSLCLGSC
jgi:hypothetical protein